MNEILSGLNSDFMSVAVVVGLLANLVLTFMCMNRIGENKQKTREGQLYIQDSKNDVKALFDAVGGQGKRIMNLERRIKGLQEAQEQFTLKEPSHQTYQHALRLIKSGESLEQVAESSGLSRGEIELLSLLRKVEDGEPLHN